MRYEQDHPLAHLAPCDWIEEADRAELEGLFVWLRAEEPILPPHAKRGRPHPSLLMLEGPPSAYGDSDLRLAGRLARHMTAGADRFGKWEDATYASVRPLSGQWHADRTTWTNGGGYRTEFHDALGLLAGSLERDLDVIAPNLESFDERFGHGPASPAP